MSEMPSMERVGKSWGPEATHAFDLLQRSELICSVARSEDSVTVVFDEFEDPIEGSPSLIDGRVVQYGARAEYAQKIRLLATCLNTLYVELTGEVVADMSRVNSSNTTVFIACMIGLSGALGGDGVRCIDHPIHRRNTEATQETTTAKATQVLK